MDIFWTVVTGVAVFVVGQAVSRFIIEPWHEYRMLVGRIAHAFILFSTANAIPGLASPTPLDEAHGELRSLAGILWQQVYAIPLYQTVARVCWWIPTYDDIQVASSNLVSLSNSVGHPGSNISGYIVNIRRPLQSTILILSRRFAALCGRRIAWQVRRRKAT